MQICRLIDIFDSESLFTSRFDLDVSVQEITLYKDMDGHNIEVVFHDPVTSRSNLEED